MRRPDVLIVEGLNVLQPPPVQPDGRHRPAPSATSSTSRSTSTPAPSDIARWYVERFLRLRETAFADPHSYFHRYAALTDDEARGHRRAASGATINEPNLVENILPTRGRATLVLSKGADHTRAPGPAAQALSPSRCAGPAPASAAARAGRGEDGGMSERIEHDSMGEVRVPGRRALAAPRPSARSRTSRSAARPCEPALDPRARPGSRRPRPRVNAELGVLDRRAGATRSRPRRARWPRAEHDDQFPIDVFQTGSGTSHQHERQRGDRHASRSLRPASRSTPTTTSTRASPPTTPSRPRSTSPRRGAVARRPAAGARPPGRRRCDAQGGRVRRRRQVRPHPPDGRHAGHPRPGVRRLRRQVALGAERLECGAAAGRASCRWAARRSAPASTPPPGFAARRRSRELAEATGHAAAPRRATTSRPRAPGTRWSS